MTLPTSALFSGCPTSSTSSQTWLFCLQAYAIVAVLVLIGLYPSRYGHGGYLLLAVALYGAALGAEWFDRQLFAFGQIVSAHTVKHLLAALAVYQVTRMLRARTST